MQLVTFAFAIEKTGVTREQLTRLVDAGAVELRRISSFDVVDLEELERVLSCEPTLEAEAIPCSDR